MPSREINLAELVRAIVAATVPEATGRARTTRVLSGNVEDLSDDLDVIFVRADRETMGTSPTESDNYGSPGIIPATRIGEAFNGEQVRMDFNGAAGATAMRTDIPSRIVLPYGAETGRRIVADGNTGRIEFYDEADRLVGLLDSMSWSIGDLTTPGARATIDPIGGLRLRSATDQLVSIIDQQGYSLKDNDSGVVTAEIKAGSFRMVDPTGTDDIQMVTSSAGTLQNPAYRSAGEANPGASLTIPDAPLFTLPVDDIEVGHVAAWIRSGSFVATMTPPTGWTERHDGNFADPAGTLQQSVATRHPATGATADFTSSLSGWQHAVGSHVVIKGGGPSSPSFRSLSTGQAMTTEDQITDSVDKPAGVVVGDVLLAFISLGVSGGLVPSGWITPPGWSFLGANFSTSGSGAAQSTVATGVWAKLATASEPASYETTINLPPGTKMLQSVIVAIQDSGLIPGGVQIRLAGHPIKRLLAFNELATPSSVLCDFQNITQSYDHLELVWDADSGTGTDIVRSVRCRCNNDSGANYHWQRVTDGVSTQGLGHTSMFVGRVDGATIGHNTAGKMDMYRYAIGARQRMQTHHSAAIASGDMIYQSGSGVWLDMTNPLTRINLFVESTTVFAAGSKAWLYGW